MKAADRKAGVASPEWNVLRWRTACIRGPEMKKSLRQALLAPLLALSASGQQPADLPRVTGAVETTVVNIDVVVTDRKGNPVVGLKAEDFEIRHDRKPVTITNFSEYRAAEAAPAPAATPGREPAARAGVDRLPAPEALHRPLLRPAGALREVDEGRPLRLAEEAPRPDARAGRRGDRGRLEPLDEDDPPLYGRPRGDRRRVGGGREAERPASDRERRPRRGFRGLGVAPVAPGGRADRRRRASSPARSPHRRTPTRRRRPPRSRGSSRRSEGWRGGRSWCSRRTASPGTPGRSSSSGSARRDRTPTART